LGICRVASTVRRSSSALSRCSAPRGAQARNARIRIPPGAGWKPRKLAGREEELDQFRVLLDRMSRGNHEPSLIFTGLRGVGKTGPRCKGTD
jgi:hypothetical protein